MFGFRYLKTKPTDYVLVYRGGTPTRQGLGFSGFVFAPFATAAAVPTDARDEIFAVEAATADYQAITIQGLISFRIADAPAAAARQDFAIDLKTGRHTGEPLKQIVERLKAITQTACRDALGRASLDAALNKSDELSRAIYATIGADANLGQGGIAIERVLVLSIKPAPDIRKALETPLREELLRRADASTFERRRAANAEEHDLKLRDEENRRALAATELANQQALEGERQRLAQARAATLEAEARAEAVALRERLKPWAELPAQQIAVLALKDWAGRDNAFQSLTVSSDAIERIAEAIGAKNP
jgi:regulator of protease activity HflC (stomatin/prohibitin superfamily)